MKKRELLWRLDENRIPYAILKISENTRIVAVERGGRVFGPFRGEDAEGLFWVSEKLKDAGQASELFGGSDWNVGGDRLWFGPEIRYSVRDRKRFWETLHTPEGIDPGHYKLNAYETQARIWQRLELKRADEKDGTAKLDVSRDIAAAENPLRELKEYGNLMENVSFCGYRQRICLEGEGEAVEAWNLLQVNAGGNVYIPMYRPEAGADYYEPAAGYEKVLEKGVLLRATGRDRYKTGYRAASVTGRIGYACEWEGTPCLLIRNFPNDPAGLYEEEPPLKPGVHGFSVHVYNDGGNSGGFAEIECTLPAVLGSSGRAKSDDIISTWIFAGDIEPLGQIARILLGSDEIFAGFPGKAVISVSQA